MTAVQCYHPPVFPSSTGVTGGMSRLRRTAELVVMLAPRELRVRYRQSSLDVAWALISPVVVLIVYGFILTQSFDVKGACAPYLTSAWTGLVIWTFFATAVGGAVTSLIASADLITKVYFPREALPLAMATAALADLAVGMITLLVLMLVQGVSIGIAAVATLLPIAVIVVWSAAISVFVGVLAAFARDTVHGVHLLLRVGFFATPVMYEASFLPSQFAWSADVNPVAVAITGVRTALLCNEWPNWQLLLIQLGAGLAALAAALWYTSRVEPRITDVV